MILYHILYIYIYIHTMYTYIFSLDVEPLKPPAPPFFVWRSFFYVLMKRSLRRSTALEAMWGEVEIPERHGGFILGKIPGLVNCHITNWKMVVLMDG